jgi:regulation of enolase protein 1 (concanavalin A-like superfamily)
MASDKEVPMHHLAARLLCAFVAGGVVAAAGLVAAPAPFPRPVRVRGPWYDGWHQPIDPVGDSRFDRQGDRLTITIPATRGRDRAARLLRDVEGDFVVQVRVGGISCTQGVKGFRRAGLVLPLGQGFVKLQWLTARRANEQPFYFHVRYSDPTQPSSLFWYSYGDRYPPPGNPAYLRLERRGDLLTLKVSADGEQWKRGEAFRFQGFRWPHRLKVGVIAEAGADTTFKAVFDQFRLTPLGGPGDRPAARPR